MQRELRTLIKRWGRRRSLPDPVAQQAVAQWREFLAVQQVVRLERVGCGQVTDHTGRRGCSLVGIVYDAEAARICHTRLLNGEDIVHELLHASRPGWSELAVRRETDRLFGPRPSPAGARAELGASAGEGAA